MPCVLLVFFTTFDARGQSTDVGFPTPVVSNEIVGRIAPRDLGDARLTRYFYALTGREGDLVITVESTNLDGAIDLFTGSTLRPLTKISLYAGASSSKAAKSVYLRREEPLILRVEARAAGDADGNYRIQFEGAFAPLASAESTDVPETPATSSAETSRRGTSGGRRVTAIGARIPETEEEKAARLETEEKERARREMLAAEAKAKSDVLAAAKETARLEKERLRMEEQERRNAQRASAAAAARNARRSETSRRSQPAKLDPANSSIDPAKPSTSVASGDATRNNRARLGATPRPGTPRSRASRARTPTPPTTSEAARSEKPDAAKTPEVKTEQPVAGARLIIETRDGSRLVREMNTVRRVTIENNQIVVVGRDGRIERQPMTNVLRMSIEP